MKGDIVQYGVKALDKTNIERVQIVSATRNGVSIDNSKDCWLSTHSRSKKNQNLQEVLANVSSEDEAVCTSKQLMIDESIVKDQQVLLFVQDDERDSWALNWIIPSITTKQSIKLISSPEVKQLEQLVASSPNLNHINSPEYNACLSLYGWRYSTTLGKFVDPPLYRLLASIKSNNEDPKYTSRFGFMALRNGFMCDTKTYRAHHVRIYRRLSDLTHLFNSNSSAFVELDYYRDGKDLYCYGNMVSDKDRGMQLFHIYSLNIETKHNIGSIDRIQDDCVRHLISYCLHYNLNNTTGTKFNVIIHNTQNENDELSFYLFIDGDYIYVQHYYIYVDDSHTRNLVYQVFPLPHHDGCSLNRPENLNKRLVDNRLLISQTDWVNTPFYSFFNLPKEILFALNNQILHEALLHRLPEVRYEDAKHRVCLGLIVYVSNKSINRAKKHEYRCVVISNTDLNQKQFTFRNLSDHLETNFNFGNISYSNTNTFDLNSKIQNSLESLPVCELDRAFIKHRLMQNLPSEFITELLGEHIVFNSNVMRGGDWNYIVLVSKISTFLNSLTPSNRALSEDPTLSGQLIQLSQELIKRIQKDYNLCVTKLKGLNNINNIKITMDQFESDYIRDLEKQLVGTIKNGAKVDKTFVDLLNSIVTLLKKFQDTESNPFYKHFLNVRLKKKWA